jgi:hypothetical protein
MLILEVYGISPAFEGQAKPVLDEIDSALSRHYRFSGEEADFVISYDVKLRMG